MFDFKFMHLYVNINYIQGHTHCYVDQVFSVISKKIRSSAWIGSVPALHELYKIAHTNEEFRNSLKILSLKFIHDWKNHFDPWVNKLVVM